MPADLPQAHNADSDFSVTHLTTFVFSKIDFSTTILYSRKSRIEKKCHRTSVLSG
jgi:hypothetical protein